MLNSSYCEIRQNKLTAPHSLKLSKVIQYVCEKTCMTPEKDMIDMICKLRGVQSQEQVHPKDWMELVCQDQVVDPNSTLLTLKLSAWKKGGDIVLFYRRKHSFHLD